MKIIIASSIVLLLLKLQLFAGDVYQNVNIFYSTIDTHITDAKVNGSENWGPVYNGNEQLDLHLKIDKIGIAWEADMIGLFVPSSTRFSVIMGIHGGLQSLTVLDHSNYNVESEKIADTIVPTTNYTADDNMFYFGIHAEVRYKTIFAKNMSYSFGFAAGTELNDNMNVYARAEDPNFSQYDDDKAISVSVTIPSGYIEPKVYFEYYPFSAAVGYRYYPESGDGAPSVYAYYNF